MEFSFILKFPFIANFILFIIQGLGMEVYTLLGDILYPLLTSRQTAEVFQMLAIWRNAVRFCHMVRASVHNTHLKEALHVTAVCEVS